MVENTGQPLHKSPKYWYGIIGLAARYRCVGEAKYNTCGYLGV
jgi:hypothetical protein